MDAELVGPVHQRQDFGVAEKGFAGYASPVQTEPSELLLLHYSNAQGQLGSSDGGNVATRASADDYYVVTGHI